MRQMTYVGSDECLPFQCDIRPLLRNLPPAMLTGLDIARERMPMAHMLSDTRPTSRPSATGADHEVAPPVAGLAALGFCCREALQNAAKSGEGARSAEGE